MRTPAELETVQRLAAEAVGGNEISRRTGVPQSTVIRWLNGGAPRFREPIDHAPRPGIRISRFSFSNRSEDIKAILCEHLDLLGIAWRRAGSQNISIARREAVAALDEFVVPKA
jgi:hypothetical protein